MVRNTNASDAERNTASFDPSTPISELVVCIQAVLRSDYGTAREGQFLLASAPIVQHIPEAFQPFVDRLG